MAKKDNYFTDLIKTTGNSDAALASEGIEAGDIKGFIPTGSFMLNAILSGSIYGGLPDNKITAIAGEEATGKTYLVLDICKFFLNQNPEAGVLYFETESAITKQTLEERGIDTSRVAIIPVTTVQEFRTQMLKIIEKYLTQSKSERKPIMFVLDSLGMLSTTKEMEDSVAGSETKDMTRAGIIKAAFRTITLKLGRAGIPLLVTNHTYDEQGKMFSQKVMSGGSGLKYAASSILFLSKAKDKDAQGVVGNIITVTNKKGRLTKENAQIKISLNYETGMNPYYGLLELGEKYGLFKKVSNKYEVNGVQAFEKHILKNPEKFFTKDILDKLDVCARNEFYYGLKKKNFNDVETGKTEEDYEDGDE